ncbi:hypothetical protein TNCV_3393831 [Trichonephila clavipes]|nr:hypothetical protein TNCV_3393831 [Trichonephila clavipes]
MQDPWFHEPDAIFSASRGRYVVGIEAHYLRFQCSTVQSLCYLVQEKTCTKITSIEQWYSRRSTAPENHTVKRVLHCPFIA